MVYVVDGKLFPGHKPRGDEYKREPTKFSFDGKKLDVTTVTGALHLYVCAACPWAHRALLTRNMSPTLREKITVSVVSPYRDDDFGWEFLSEDNKEKVEQFTKLPVTIDKSPVNAKYLNEIYIKASPDYTGNITTPVLYDSCNNKILSNDSFEIMRVLAQAVPDDGSDKEKRLLDLYVRQRGDDCSKLDSNKEIINNIGRQIDENLAKRVYMCGLAKTQEAYEKSCKIVFQELDKIDLLLSQQPYMVKLGTAVSSFSLADVQLISCLVRFDPVYFDLFKCYNRRISSYKNISSYLRRVVENDIGVANMDLDLHQIVCHYWSNFTSCNPNGVVPVSYHEDYLLSGVDKYKDTTNGRIVIDQNSAKDHKSAEEQDQTNKKERQAQGEFVRGVSAHRNWLGGENNEEFPLEENRYVLFVANNCPWCHRALLSRNFYPDVKKYVRVSIMFYRRGGPDGRWQFLPNDENEFKQFEMDRPELLEGVDKNDPTGNGFVYAPDIYKLSDPESTQVSVPILFDTVTKRVVSNESADLVRMFSMIGGKFDESLLEKTETINARVYQDVNNGAYRAGFSSNQEAHVEAVEKYFTALDWLNNILSKTKFLLSDTEPTEVDLRLFPTIYRHDPVYHSRMKLNSAMIRDYDHLNRWLIDMKNIPAIAEASRIEHSAAGYFGRTGNCLVPFSGLEHDGVKEY